MKYFVTCSSGELLTRRDDAVCKNLMSKYNNNIIVGSCEAFEDTIASYLEQSNRKNMYTRRFSSLSFFRAESKRNCKDVTFFIGYDDSSEYVLKITLIPVTDEILMF